ncbi:MAG: dipeptide epimerase [Isosphaeraceae bacterium]
MSIRTIELFHVAVPLRTKVRHASHERTVSDNLIVKVTLDSGEFGYGEGVPRSYVTGETVASTFATLRSIDLAQQVGRPTTYDQVVSRLERLEFPETQADSRGMMGNSARCAFELAALDAYGQRFQQGLGHAVRKVKAPGLEYSLNPTRVRYSGAITAGTRSRERASAWKLWLYGFREIKLKIGLSDQDDPARLRTLRKILGPRVDLRLDVNEAWAAVEVVERTRSLLPYFPSVLEQPVKHEESGALAELRPHIGMPVMLDESLCGYPDAVRAIEQKTADLFNVRLSKCGGIIPSLRIMGLAQSSGIGLQLGCHPGETGLLSAAGRHVAGNVRGIRYTEGSYDRHILARNLIVENVTFGYAGLAPPIQGWGLGVKVDHLALEELTKDHQVIHYE